MDLPVWPQTYPGEWCGEHATQEAPLAEDRLRLAVKILVRTAICQADHLPGTPADKADRISNDAADAVMALLGSQGDTPDA